MEAVVAGVRRERRPDGATASRVTVPGAARRRARGWPDRSAALGRSPEPGEPADRDPRRGVEPAFQGKPPDARRVGEKTNPRRRATTGRLRRYQAWRECHGPHGNTVARRAPDRTGPMARSAATRATTGV